MKILLIVAILLCLAGVMACEDIAIGDYPIMKIDDAVIICLQPGDDHFLILYPTACYVSVSRPYDDHATIDFSETYYEEILSVTIVKRP